MKIIAVALFSILLFSCDFGTKNGNELVQPLNQSKSAKNQDSVNLGIGLFHSIPDTIDGCGDFYSYSLAESKNSKYVFLSNLNEFSMMKINGVTEYFLIVQDTSINFNHSNYIQKASSEKYNIVCEYFLIKKYDEGGFYKIKIILTNKQNKQLKILNLVGQSGC